MSRLSTERREKHECATQARHTRVLTLSSPSLMKLSSVTSARSALRSMSRCTDMPKRSATDAICARQGCAKNPRAQSHAPFTNHNALKFVSNVSTQAIVLDYRVIPSGFVDTAYVDHGRGLVFVSQGTGMVRVPYHRVQEPELQPIRLKTWRDLDKRILSLLRTSASC
jgi:hypothetical protein